MRGQGSGIRGQAAHPAQIKTSSKHDKIEPILSPLVVFCREIHPGFPRGGSTIRILPDSWTSIRAKGIGRRYVPEARFPL